MARIDALNGRCRLLDLLVQRRPVSDQLPEQPMPGAVPQQDPMAEAGDPGLKVPLGIEPAEEQCISREQGHEGDIVFLSHGVMGRDGPAVIDLLYG